MRKPTDDEKAALAGAGAALAQSFAEEAAYRLWGDRSYCWTFGVARCAILTEALGLSDLKVVDFVLEGGVVTGLDLAVVEAPAVGGEDLDPVPAPPVPADDEDHHEDETG